MVETLTESFCERCGTRYEFKAPTRLNPLRKTRGFVGGLKNYLMSQDALSDAMGDAMRSEEETLASAQLDAFHESFNFCIDCRQYTCINCWNDGSGRCRSCAPIPGTDDLAERLEAAFVHTDGVAPATNGDAAPADHEIHRHLDPSVWPTSDLPISGGIADPASDPWPTADAPLVTPEPEPEPEPMVAEAPETEPEPERPPLRVVAWDEDTSYEVEPEPVVAEVEPEPEPVVAEVEPEPEREAPARQRIAPISETILHFPHQSHETEPAVAEEPVAAEDQSPELAARRAQLDLLGLGDPGEGPVTPARQVLPYRSRGAAASAGETAAHRGASFWEASAREVASATGQIGVQNCGQCGLSLSANARFCRRCGTRQAQSA